MCVYSQTHTHIQTHTLWALSNCSFSLEIPRLHKSAYEQNFLKLCKATVQDPGFIGCQAVLKTIEILCLVQNPTTSWRVLSQFRSPNPWIFLHDHFCHFRSRLYASWSTKSNPSGWDNPTSYPFYWEIIDTDSLYACKAQSTVWSSYIVKWLPH